MAVKKQTLETELSRIAGHINRVYNSKRAFGRDDFERLKRDVIDRAKIIYQLGYNTGFDDGYDKSDQDGEMFE